MAPNKTRRHPFGEVISVELKFTSCGGIAVHRFYQSSFGSFLDELFEGHFTKPSRESFLLLSLGFVFAFTRHTVAGYLWRAGATAFKHFTRFYVFLGAPCYARLDRLFERVIMRAIGHVPEDELVRVRFDETTTKKTGRKIEGCSSYRNGAGTARQEYRTLFGLNFRAGARCASACRPWPDAFVSVPIGLALYLKKHEAKRLGRPYRRRSELAREMLDRLCRVVGPERTVLSVQDGNYSTRAFLQELPENATRGWGDSTSTAHSMGSRSRSRRGSPDPKLRRVRAWAIRRSWPKRPIPASGSLIPKTTPPRCSWSKGSGTRSCRACGCVWRWSVARRERPRGTRKSWRPTSRASCGSRRKSSSRSTVGGGRSRSSYARRVSTTGWARIAAGRYERIVGVNGLRMVLGAAQVLWFVRELEQHEEVALDPYQPWYAQKERSRACMTSPGPCASGCSWRGLPRQWVYGKVWG